MHAYRSRPATPPSGWRPAWPWAAGYAAMGALFLAARWITEPGEGHG